MREEASASGKGVNFPEVHSLAENKCLSQYVPLPDVGWFNSKLKNWGEEFRRFDWERLDLEKAVEDSMATMPRKHKIKARRSMIHE